MYDTYLGIFVHMLWVNVGVVQSFVYVGACRRVIWLLTIICVCGNVLWLLARTQQNSLSINHVYPRILLNYLYVCWESFCALFTFCWDISVAELLVYLTGEFTLIHWHIHVEIPWHLLYEFVVTGIEIALRYIILYYRDTRVGNLWWYLRELLMICGYMSV